MPAKRKTKKSQAKQEMTATQMQLQLADTYVANYEQRYDIKLSGNREIESVIDRAISEGVTDRELRQVVGRIARTKARRKGTFPKGEGAGDYVRFMKKEVPKIVRAKIEDLEKKTTAKPKVKVAKAEPKKKRADDKFAELKKRILAQADKWATPAEVKEKTPKVEKTEKPKKASVSERKISKKERVRAKLLARLDTGSKIKLDMGKGPDVTALESQIKSGAVAKEKSAPSKPAKKRRSSEVIEIKPMELDVKTVERVPAKARESRKLVVSLPKKKKEKKEITLTGRDAVLHNNRELEGLVSSLEGRAASIGAWRNAAKSPTRTEKQREDARKRLAKFTTDYARARKLLGQVDFGVRNTAKEDLNRLRGANLNAKKNI